MNHAGYVLTRVTGTKAKVAWNEGDQETGQTGLRMASPRLGRCPTLGDGNMSDLEFLYAVMSVFYLWECSHWLRTDVIPFVSWLGGTFRIARPYFVANSHEAGLALASPVPLWGTFFTAAEWPVAVSPAGVANAIGDTVLFADHPRFRTRRNRLTVNKSVIAKLSSPAQARWLAGKLNGFAAAPEAERDALILNAVKGALEDSAVASRLDEFYKVARLSSAVAAGLALFVFIVAPAGVWYWGVVRTWPWLLGGLVILCVVNAVAFVRAHRKLHPELDDERFAHLLMVLLFPPAGMRARDMLSRPLLEPFHPLAVARVLCDAGPFGSMAGCALRELRYPRADPPGMNARAHEIWGEFNRILRSQIEQFVSRDGLQPEQCVAAPVRSDAECLSYCPRCHSQFILAQGTCSDCGVTLVRWVHRDTALP